MFDVLNAKNLAIRTLDTSTQRVWEFIGSTVLTSKSLLTEGNFQNFPFFLTQVFLFVWDFSKQSLFQNSP